MGMKMINSVSFVAVLSCLPAGSCHDAAAAIQIRGCEASTGHQSQVNPLEALHSSMLHK